MGFEPTSIYRPGATSYTGSYSTDGTTWHTVATVSVPGQADAQDAGMFVTSHAAGVPATVQFNRLSVSP